MRALHESPTPTTSTARLWNHRVTLRPDLVWKGSSPLPDLYLQPGQLSRASLLSQPVQATPSNHRPFPLPYLTSVLLRAPARLETCPSPLGRIPVLGLCQVLQPSQQTLLKRQIEMISGLPALCSTQRCAGSLTQQMDRRASCPPALSLLFEAAPGAGVTSSQEAG